MDRNDGQLQACLSSYPRLGNYRLGIYEILSDIWNKSEQAFEIAQQAAIPTIEKSYLSVIKIRQMRLKSLRIDPMLRFLRGKF
ncbi:MAG: hypothetical protein AAGI49_20100, partial [Bacteroidota bacterium]